MFSTKFDLGVALPLFELTEPSSDFVVSAFVFFALTKEVRFEELVLSLDLLVVLLHRFESLHKLFDGKRGQVDVT